MGSARAVGGKVRPTHEEIRGVAEKVRVVWVAIQKGEEISGTYEVMLREALEAGARMERAPFAAFNLEMPLGILLASMVGLGDRVRVLGQEVRSLSRTIASLAEETAVLRERLETSPIIRHSRLLDLGTPQYVLKEPIHVIIEEYADETIASYPEISTYASGDAEGEAIAKLKAGILALYEDLVSSKPEELGPLPLGWLRILRRIIEKRG